MKKSINYIKNNMLLIILACQPFLDILAYIQRDFSISMAGYIRLALTVCVPLYTLIVTKKKKPFFLIMAIIAGFCFLHVLNTLRGGAGSFFNDTKYMLLVAHAPIMLFSFMFLYEKESIKKQITIALILNVITSVVVFYLSYLLQSGNCTYPLFQTGWTGWYVIPNAQSLILSSLITFAIYFSIKYCKYYFPLLSLPLIYMYTMNGTKATFGALLIAFGSILGFTLLEVIFLKAKRERFEIYKILMSVVLIAVSLACYTFSPRQIINSTTEAHRQQEQAALEEQQELEEELAEEEEKLNDKESDDSGDKVIKNKKFYVKYINPNLIDRFGANRVLDAYADGDNLNSYGLSNMRLKKLIYARLTWEECDFVTRLVGFDFTKMQHKDDNFDLENDPQAILYYYGYFGAALYIAFIGYFLLRLLKKLFTKFKESFNLYNFTLLITLVLQLVSAAYSGYMLRRPNVAIYLAITLLLIYCQTEPLFKKKDIEKAEYEK